MAKGKRYLEAKKSIDPNQSYELDEAVDKLLSFKAVKFDQTLDIAIRLGVDPKHADQMVRGISLLPHGTGKKVAVAVIAKGEQEQAAKDAGADHVGGDDLVKKIQDGWFGFDKLIVTPDMMSKVGKLGTVLGPRGLMPNPKAGTVTPDVAKAVEQIKAGRIEYRVDKTGIIHAIVGKISFEKSKLIENIKSLMESIVKARPASSKGTYLKSVTLSPSMGPGVRIDPSAF